MRKAYLITISAFLLFITLFLLVDYYYVWNSRIEGDVAETKHLDKVPYIFDDVQYSMRGAMETQLEFDSSEGSFIVKFTDTIPATTNIQTSLSEYETFLENEHDTANNVEIELDQTRFFSDPRITFTNGLIYNYTDLDKTGVFFQGGGPQTSGVILEITADRQWNDTVSDWQWNNSGEIDVYLDIRDSNDQQLEVMGSTFGRVSMHRNNTVLFNFLKEGAQIPALRVSMGNVDGETGSVKIEQVNLVSFESELTVNVTNYGPVRAQLPVTLNVSGPIANVHGLVILDEL